MQVNFTVWRYTNQTIKAISASGVVTLANAETAHLAAVFPGLVFPVVPVEHRSALVQRLIHVRTGDRFLICVDCRVIVDRIDPANLQPVDTQFPCGLVYDGRHCRGHLILPRPALCTAWRGIGQYRQTAKAHRIGIINQRDSAARRGCVTTGRVSANVLDNKHICGRGLAVGGKAHLHPALEADTGGTHVVLLFTRYAQLHRTANLFREVAGKSYYRISADLGAKTAARILTDEHDVFKFDAQHAGKPWQKVTLALCRTMHVTRTVLPVRHRRTGLHAHMCITGGYERLLDDDFRSGKTFFKITVSPFVHELTAWLVASSELVNLLAGPFYSFETGAFTRA